MPLTNKVEAHFVASQSLLFAFNLSSFEPQLELAKIAISELKITNPEKRTSNVYGEWLSPKNSHLLNEKLQPLCKLITDICGEIWRDVFSQGQGEFGDDFYIWQCWAISYGNGGYAASHNHFPAFFAAVLYLEADDTSAPIVFGNSTEYRSFPNALYIFPGALQHEVPVNTGKRVVIAMNILKRNPV
jgi:hypothetical protein